MGRLTDQERSIVMQFRNEGNGFKKIVRRLQTEKNITISKRGVKKIIQKFDATGMVQDKARKKRKMLHTAEHEAFVNGTMEAVSDMSAAVLVREIEGQFQITASITTVSRYRRKLGWKQHLTRYCQLMRDANKEKRKI